jgi:hypothetical protein
VIRSQIGSLKSSSEKPFRIESSSPGGFRARANRSYQRVSGCYCASARAHGSGGLPKGGQPKERRRKAGQSEHARREGHAVWAGSVKTFRRVGGVKNDTADLWMKGDLRVKRRDPWHRANAPPKAAADPALNGEDADQQSQTCLYLVRGPVAQPSAQAS